MPSKLLIIDPRDAGEDHPLVDYLRANARSVFETPEWYRLLSMMSMRSGDTPLLCGVQDDGGTVVAALPLLLTNETRRGRAIHRYGSLTNYFSLHYRLVAAPDLCDEAYQLLGREVRGRRAGLLRFDALQADDVPALEAVLSAAGLRSHRYEHFANWIEPVDGRSFEQYFDGRPSVLRSTHRRRRRKLQKSFKTRIVIYLGQEPDFEEGKAAYGKVYASSWKKANSSRISWAASWICWRPEGRSGSVCFMRKRSRLQLNSGSSMALARLSTSLRTMRHIPNILPGLSFQWKCFVMRSTSTRYRSSTTARVMMRTSRTGCRSAKFAGAWRRMTSGDRPEPCLRLTAS